MRIQTKCQGTVLFRRIDRLNKERRNVIIVLAEIVFVLTAALYQTINKIYRRHNRYFDVLIHLDSMNANLGLLENLTLLVHNDTYA